MQHAESFEGGYHADAEPVTEVQTITDLGPTHWTALDTSKTLQFYRNSFERYDDSMVCKLDQNGVDDTRKYGYNYRYGPAFIKSLFLELAQLVPQGATKVLDLGCGGGGFAKVLHEQRPELQYLGVDLCPFFIEEGRKKMAGIPGYTFECCDFWTFFLGGNTPTARLATCQADGELGDSTSVSADWDFVISCAGVFSHCGDTNTGLEQQLQLLDAIERSASRGFILICHGADSGQGVCMDAARVRVEGYAAQAGEQGHECPGDAHAQAHELSDGLPGYFVSPVNGRGWKPCLKKIQYKHRLIVLVR